MRNIIILILIIFYWFFLSTVLAYMAADPSIQDLGLGDNDTYDIDIDTTSVNITGEITEDGKVSAGDILGMAVRIFTLRVPYVHISVNFIISFINWILLLVLAVVIYRLASPLTGG